MSYLMDYGEDWPEPKPVELPPLRLWQKLLATTVLFGIIYAAGAITLHVIAPYDVRVHTPTSGRHGVDVTTTLPPANGAHHGR